MIFFRLESALNTHAFLPYPEIEIVGITLHLDIADANPLSQTEDVGALVVAYAVVAVPGLPNVHIVSRLAIKAVVTNSSHADKFVRLHGKLNFAQGGSFADVIYVFKHYGAVPGELYKGLEYGQDNHVHDEIGRAHV